MLQLRRPGLADGGSPTVDLDPSQLAAVDRFRGGWGAAGTAVSSSGALLVVGAPGSGKTTVVVESALAAVEAGGLDPGQVLILAATRRGAADLRDRLSARLQRTTGSPLVRTASSAAFAVLRTRATLLREPLPSLITGPEQDLVIGELLAGHAAGEGVPLGWPDTVPSEVLGLRGFRDELRDLLMRAAERGLDPVDLARLATEHASPEWLAAARFYEEYLAVTRLRQVTPDAGQRFDAATVVDEAAEALASWETEVPGHPCPRWRLVVVDDHQESTAAIGRFLRVLADDGARLLLAADPDAAVQTFRGASPQRVVEAELPGPGAGRFDAERLVLSTVWRQNAVLREVTRRVATALATSGMAQHRAAAATPDAEPAVGTADASLRVALLPTSAQEAAFVAHHLRRAHLHDEAPWESMAVVVRSGGQVAALRRALAAADVPVSVLGSDLPLRLEPAVQPLLVALQCVLDGADEGAGQADVDTGVALLTSPLGGLDSIGLRRLRLALRVEELAGGGGRASDALIVETLADPARSASLPSTVRRGVSRVATMLEQGRRAARQPGADAQTVLWALWSGAEVAEIWRRAALSGGPVGTRADRDLDAVLALFRAAETFVDRLPQAPPSAFLEYLQSQDLPADTLAAQTSGRGTVAVLTPAGAAGREWDHVVVAGVQDGVWPDLRLRDSLLGAGRLVEVCDQRDVGPGDSAALARRAVLSDEIRSFLVATSRARTSLLVTAVAGEDQLPSVLVDLVEPAVDDVGADPRLTRVSRPLDLSGVVAGLRADLEASVTRGPVGGAAPGAGGTAPGPGGGAPAAPVADHDEEAARLLAVLARDGVDGADPRHWYSLAPVSSDGALWGPQDIVPVSPSKVELVRTCALRWALESAGGTAPSAVSQSLGTLVHSLAQNLPQGTYAELSAELDRRWGELGLSEGWTATAERRRADRMVRRLADYLAQAAKPALLEAPFVVDVGRARVRGTVDRVEWRDDGTVEVVDLKTGRRAPKEVESEENPQLGSYQLAVDAGALDGLPAGTRSSGARLVFLGDVNKGYAERHQGQLEADENGLTKADRAIAEAADSMAAARFTATVNDLCPMCPVRRSCPAQDDGLQVGQ
jgi:superfamily I DNA/RNA helicase/RecB family exonuclease